MAGAVGARAGAAAEGSVVVAAGAVAAGAVVAPGAAGGGGCVWPNEVSAKVREQRVAVSSVFIGLTKGL